MMDKKIFGSVLEHPTRITPSELAELSEVMAFCPASSLVRMLVWMGSLSCIPQFEVPQVQYEVYLPNIDFARECLDASNFSIQPSAPAAVPPASEPQPQGDILSEINAYHDVSFKTAPKSVILSSFLEAVDCNIANKEPVEATRVEVLAKKSNSMDDTFCTETLAVVLEKQGKFEKAIAVYEKLMCKYPEKSSTFATRIEYLKSIIENK